MFSFISHHVKFLFKFVINKFTDIKLVWQYFHVFVIYYRILGNDQKAIK